MKNKIFGLANSKTLFSKKNLEFVNTKILFS